VRMRQTRTATETEESQSGLFCQAKTTRWTHRAQRAVPSMTLNRYQEKRRKVLRGRRALRERAPTNPDRGIEMPTRPQGLDPIVAEIIETLARTIIRDDDHRASSTPTDKNG
jgi:hypothetical protein